VDFGGHCSPIGGYLKAADLVFVLDVNPAYQPWLVERARLFDAVNTLDGAKKRGLLLIGIALLPFRWRSSRYCHDPDRRTTGFQGDQE
jgi:hypothetical protein